MFALWCICHPWRMLLIMVTAGYNNLIHCFLSIVLSQSLQSVENNGLELFTQKCAVPAWRHLCWKSWNVHLWIHGLEQGDYQYWEWRHALTMWSVLCKDYGWHIVLLKSNACQFCQKLAYLFSLCNWFDLMFLSEPLMAVKYQSVHLLCVLFFQNVFAATEQQRACGWLRGLRRHSGLVFTGCVWGKYHVLWECLPDSVVE